MRKQYPSDVTREQFEVVRPVLERARKHTKPRTVDLYEIFCGVLHVLKSGCQWRMLPDAFPSWQTCYAYWRKWSAKENGKPSLLEEALKKYGRRRSTRPWAGCPDKLPYR